MRNRSTTQPPVERLVAIGYGLTYDAVVRGFAPYEALLAEIAGLVARAATPGPPAATRVLDVSCGTGTLAARLAREGWTVVGIDSVSHLIDVGRRRHSDSGLSLSFQHADAARDPIPGAGTYDVLVSMHTLYWHPNPEALLAACRKALRPGGHAVFLTYTRPAHVVATFSDVRRQRGWWEALRSLRWLVPTALFELFRHVTRRYLGPEEFRTALREAGFEVLETRGTFLAGISLLAWTRTDDAPAAPIA